MGINDLTTREFANLWRVEPGTIRTRFCENGHYAGVRPVKLPNGRLLWPRDEVAAALESVKKDDLVAL